MASGLSALDDRQRRVAERVLREEGALRAHLVVALSGSHAYGFPSPDSDLDLKAVHVEPTARLLGLMPAGDAANRLETVDGVEIDYTSNEISAVLVGILSGNGNYAERILGPIILETTPEHAALRALVARALSKRLYRHYRGFATSQMKAVDESDIVTAKRVLYVLRTTLTGAHVLRTGALVTDLEPLAYAYGFGEVRALIEAKRAGEQTPLAKPVVDQWRGALGRAFETLDLAYQTAILPEEAPNKAELESWLIALRQARF